jgi:biopolymer transport protein ExbB/TolQ
MQSIHDLLSQIADAFLAPTLLATLLAFVYGTFLVGQFLAAAADRRLNLASWRKLSAEAYSLSAFRELPWKGHMARFAFATGRLPDAPELVEKEVADMEHEMTAHVDRLGVVSKVGPMLGLIGTLIPLKPALAGLARGDMQAMGANLEIGFTTTVVGLLVGGSAYAISAAYRNWHQQEVTNIHFLLDQWNSKEGRREETPALAAIR